LIVPLRLKLALLTSLLLLAGIGTVSALVLERARDALIVEAEKRAVSLARHLARNARDPVLLEDDLVVAKLVDGAAQEAEVLAARIIDTNGALVASSRTSDADAHARLTTESRRATQRQGNRLVVGERMTFKDVDVGEAQVVIDLDALIAPVLTRARRDLLLASGGLLSIGILIAFAASTRVTRPLQRLRVAVNALAAGDLAARVEPSGRDEVSDLTRAFNEMGQSLSQKRKVETAFRRYVSDHVLRQVLDRPDEIALHGESREVSVVFIDIRNYTRLSDALGPERIVAFLNEAFEMITARLLDHGATVDKYLGDAVLAYFGAPIESSDHVQRAVAAAISVQRSVDERNRKLEARGEPFVPLNVGIGIATGRVVVGNIGSELKMDYTAIGEPVNVANRLQKLAGAGGIFATEAVARRLDGLVATESVGLRRIEGYDDPVELFKVPY
jgi:class 3 adenylate cyclase